MKTKKISRNRCSLFIWAQVDFFSSKKGSRKSRDKVSLEADNRLDIVDTVKDTSMVGPTDDGEQLGQSCDWFSSSQM